MHPLAQRVLNHIRREELLGAGDRVGVAVSGGIDSVALLRLLLEVRGELGIVLCIVHFNHKLRGEESDGDERFVAGVARKYGLGFYADEGDAARYAADARLSLEAAARELRYGFFRRFLGEGSEPQELKPSHSVVPKGTAEAAPFYEPSSLRSAQAATFQKPPSLGAASQEPSIAKDHSGTHKADASRGVQPADTLLLDKIATGHTLDDQAETVLMRVIRGAGLRGLGGIHSRIAVEDDQEEICGEIMRPLLGVRRRELEAYLRDINQTWREDATNLDERFTRNRIRRLLVPLLEKEFNPSVAENLAELANIAQGEEDYWDNEVAGWMGTAVQWSEPEWAQASSEGGALVQIASVPSKFDDASNLETKIDNATWLVADATRRSALVLESAAGSTTEGSQSGGGTCRHSS